MTSPSRSPHILLSCAEASGERYALRLVAALRELDPDIRFSALGGPALREAGVETAASSEGLAIMGFGEVPSVLRRLLSVRGRIRRRLERGDIDLFLPIDFPGFNLRLARDAKRRGVPVYYLVAPQLWAWGAWRAGGLRKSVDRLGAILPFEPAFFEPRGVPTVHLGHPLLEDYPEEDVSVREARLRDGSRPLRLGLLPGSRGQEVSRLLPVFLEAAGGLRSSLAPRRVELLLSRAPGARFECPATDDLHIDDRPLPELLTDLDLALVCSGTASLEAALAGVPHAVAYRTSPLNYLLARRLVKVERIGLANLIADRSMVPEFVQNDVTAAALVSDLLGWLEQAARRDRLYADCLDLRERLGGPGFWARTAADVLDFLGDRT